MSLFIIADMKMRASYNAVDQVSHVPIIIADMKMRASYNSARLSATSF